MSVPGRPLRVLVVDDNDDDIELLRLTFARAGPRCEVAGATSPERARRLLEDPARRPDLVLLDWKMPGMGAPELLRAVRADTRTVGLPLIVFSSSDDPQDVRTAYDAGATAYLLKPPGLVEYEGFVRDLYAFWSRAVLG